MQQSKIRVLARLFGKTYRENISYLAKDLLNKLFDVSAHLSIDPKMLMRELITQRPHWPGIAAGLRPDLDLALRLMSAEDETIRTINAQPADQDLLEQGLKLLGLWAKQHFQKGVVKTAIETAKPLVAKLSKAYPDLDDEDLIFFLLEQFQDQLTNHPSAFKDSGLLEDILQKMLL